MNSRGQHRVSIANLKKHLHPQQSSLNSALRNVPLHNVLYIESKIRVAIQPDQPVGTTKANIDPDNMRIAFPELRFGLSSAYGRSIVSFVCQKIGRQIFPKE